MWFLELALRGQPIVFGVGGGICWTVPVAFWEHAGLPLGCAVL